MSTRQGRIGRADLVTALAGSDKRQVKYVADAIGLYQSSIVSPENVDSKEVKPKEYPQKNEEHVVQERPPIGFLRLHQMQKESRSAKAEHQPAELQSLEWENRPQQPPVYRVLAPSVSWFLTSIASFLRQHTTGKNPDIPKVVSLAAKKELFQRLPLRSGPSVSGDKLLVIDDRHLHLAPYWRDHSLFRRLLSLHYPDLVQQAVLRDGSVALRPISSADGLAGRALPVAGSSVVIFSDLGALSLQSDKPVAAWLALARQLQRQRCRTMVLLPCHPDEVDTRFKRLFQLESWGGFKHLPKTGKDDYLAQADHLLTALAPAIRIEPGLLRQLRLSLAEQDLYGHLAMGAESYLWQSADIQEPHSVAASWNAASRVQRLQEFALLPDEVKQLALETIRIWRQTLAKEVWFDEVVSLDRSTQHLVVEDFRQACRYFKHIECVLVESTDAEYVTELEQWLRRLHRRMPGARYEDKEIGPTLERIKRKVLPDDTKYINPANIEAESLVKTAYLCQTGSEIRLAEQSPHVQQPIQVGAVLAKLRLQHDWIRLERGGNRICELKLNGQTAAVFRLGPEFTVVSGTEICQFDTASIQSWATGMAQRQNALVASSSNKRGEVYDWVWQNEQLDSEGGVAERGVWYQFVDREGGTKPTWAEELFRDQHGIYADLKINTQSQRFRWIEPGTFMMGSPLEEVDRDDDEVLHEVSVTQGFWLADTTVTQALWQVVMGENPSDFKNDDANPVENISWKDAQTFIERLNAQGQGLKLRLPTEAEWEYACRAGDQAPFSFGETISTEQVNYDGNYPYANGAKGHYRKKTVAVKSLPVNAWGLYEMHGNVWEWCNDWYGSYPQESVVDPEGPPAGGDRVVRGGSGFSGGGLCRSAIRFWFGPGDRCTRVGLRLAQGHELKSSGSQPGSERVPPRRGAAAERDGGQATQSGMLLNSVKKPVKKR